jgi:methionine--tRNA ligase beta chain
MKEEEKNKISFEDFKKVEIKVGRILSADRIPDTDKLLKLMVALAEGEPRQIVSGIAEYFPEPGQLVGTKCLFVTNLEPRMIRGYESNGMLFAMGGKEGMPFSLLAPTNPDIPEGTAGN